MKSCTLIGEKSFAHSCNENRIKHTALRVVEGGRVPDDATVDVLARRIAAGGAAAAGGADHAVCDGFLKGAVADGR